VASPWNIIFILMEQRDGGERVAYYARGVGHYLTNMHTLSAEEIVIICDSFSSEIYERSRIHGGIDFIAMYPKSLRLLCIPTVCQKFPTLHTVGGSALVV
jgi:hypothetical protein